MCLFIKFHLQGSRGPEIRSLLVVNEQFSDKRNAANGTLWTDTIYRLSINSQCLFRMFEIKAREPNEVSS